MKDTLTAQKHMVVLSGSSFQMLDHVAPSLVRWSSRLLTTKDESGRMCEYHKCTYGADRGWMTICEGLFASVNAHGGAEWYGAGGVRLGVIVGTFLY